MAKRTRGSSRPGRNRPGQRPAAKPGRPAAPGPAQLPARPTRPTDGLTEAEIARAAELEALAVAEERAAEDAQRRARDRARRSRDLDDEGGPRARNREAGMLGARAAEEYAYVVRDVRRITAVGGMLLGILAALFVIIEVAGLIRV